VEHKLAQVEAIAKLLVQQLEDENKNEQPKNKLSKKEKKDKNKQSEPAQGADSAIEQE